MSTIKLSRFLTLALATAALVGLSACKHMSGSQGTSDVVTKEAQAGMTPAQVYADLKAGNARFVSGNAIHRDYLGQAVNTAGGQYPKAVVLGCLDSRVPPEIVFDQGIGDLFVGRVAGNFENPDLLGSFEFATKLAGSKVIVVLGHTECGAVKGAVGKAKLGNLTQSLTNLDGAISAASRRIQDASNEALVAATIEENVKITMKDLTERSAVLTELVNSGDLMIVGGVYDLASGQVNWIE